MAGRRPWWIGVLLVAAALPGGGRAEACSCAWAGPFLVVAPRAPLVVRATVLRHVAGSAGAPEAVEVRVDEVLRGEPSGRQLRVFGDAGWLCRVAADRFADGTTYLLALDGPGSKPGAAPSPAVSSCGSYWLRLEGEEVVGAIDGTQEQPVQRMPLGELVRRLAAGGREAVRFVAELRAGQRLERPLGSHLRLVLEPDPEGWQIAVEEDGRDENLARLSPPLHGPCNPLSVSGWQLAPVASRDELPNRPPSEREIVFSPDVGRSVDGAAAGRAPTPEDVERVRAWGRGTVRLLEWRLEEGAASAAPRIAWLRLEVEATWPAAAPPGP